MVSPSVGASAAVASGDAVSFTHLTLPTSDLGVFSGAAGSLKKNTKNYQVDATIVEEQSESKKVHE